MALRLRLSVSGGRNFRRRLVSQSKFIGNLITEDELFLLTQDGRGFELNQLVIPQFGIISTQDNIQLLTQSGQPIVTNQNLVDNTQGLLTESGLEFITQDGRSILTNAPD